MTRKIFFVPGEFYHIYNRGTDKRVIFKNTKDYNRFVLLLYLCNSTKPVNIEAELQKGRTFLELMESNRGDELVDIGAYCLMPNHFHILIKEKNEKGISLFMKKLSTAYSMYFNKKYDRSGALFEGRFKAKHISDDAYLKYLFAYIHLNPIKIIDSEWKENGICNKSEAKIYLSKYEYSSYLDYLGKNRAGKTILNSKAFPNYFEDFSKFNSFVNEWLYYKEE